MKNEKLLESIISVKDLCSLPPSDLLSYITLLRSMATSSTGPFGVNDFDDKSIYLLNRHIVRLFKQQGMVLPGASDFLATLSTYSPPNVQPDNTGPTLEAHTFTDAAIEYSVRSHLRAERWVNNLPPSLKDVAQKTLAAIKTLDTTREISLLTYSFQQSLNQSGYRQSPGLHSSYGTANIVTWIAYTLYDQLTDEERRADGRVLATANLCAREALRLYTSLHPHSELPMRLFNECDAALGIEGSLRSEKSINNLLDYKRLLHRKSIVHCLGPLLSLEAIAPHKLPVAEKALRLYCAARQLNDDLHDWKEDFVNKQYQYVVARIIKDASKGVEPADSSSMTKELLGNTFWRTTMSDILYEQTHRIDRATLLLQELGFHSNQCPFAALTLEPIRMSIIAARQRNEFEKVFLTSL